jgi:predicted RNA-binding Zn ribbon-like protein
MSGVKLLFAHDVELSLGAACELINSAPRESNNHTEGLPDPAVLDDFASRWRYSGSRTHDEAELRAVRAIRPQLRQFWERDEDGVAELTNELLRASRALPQLRKHDEFDWHLHAEPPGADLATRIKVETAMSFVDVIRADELGRLRICADPSCDNVLFDLSKNRSRRFCDAGCGNRANVAAYRERQRSGR